MRTPVAALTIVILLPCQLAQSQGQTLQPYETTSRGNISWQSTEAYKHAIESCSTTHGPQFVACLRQQVRSAAGGLDETYNATKKWLKSSPEEVARLRQSQRAWLEFQKANCEFARAVAPKEAADEFFFDCILRSTIERHIELRSLVGD